MRARKIARCGLAVALALVLSYVESLVPLSVAVPGVKLGLANIAVVYALYRLGTGEAAVISGLRVILVSLLFGSGASLFYSAAGALLSFLVMWGLKKWGKPGILAVSAVGGVCHNFGQIAAAALLMETAGILWYFPVLLLTGTLAGAFIGLAAGLLVTRLKPEPREK